MKKKAKARVNSGTNIVLLQGHKVSCRLAVVVNVTVNLCAASELQYYDYQFSKV